MELTTVWFILIAVLWIGYFVLEGFDFGVGILFPVLGRDDPDSGETGEIRRRVMLSTVGPVWDGNEVWLLTAGGATFAAFPNWYATLFSGFYLPLLLILVALIMRALAFDYRGKVDDPVWRQRWDWAIFGGSLAPALLWGVAFTNIVRGVPIDAEMEYTGNLFTLLNPAALLGGVTTVALFTAYGAMFLALKTDGAIRAKAREIALRVGLAAAVLAVAWLAVIHATTGSVESWIMAGAGAVLLLGALAMLPSGREGWAFALAFAAIGMSVGSLFVALFPDVMPSTTDPGVLADDHQCVVDRLHAEDHDVGGGRVHPDRDPVPGLELLDVPQAGVRPSHSHRGGAGGPARSRTPAQAARRILVGPVGRGQPRGLMAPFDPSLLRALPGARSRVARLAGMGVVSGALALGQAVTVAVGGDGDRARRSAAHTADRVGRHPGDARPGGGRRRDRRPRCRSPGERRGALTAAAALDCQPA
jgi:cytochrome d ubiquinol oxidase subunit II